MYIIHEIYRAVAAEIIEENEGEVGQSSEVHFQGGGYFSRVFSSEREKGHI